MIGWPVTSRTDSAAPPRASPSSLVRTTPVNPTPSRNACAVLTASWPIMASTTNSISCGSTADADVGRLLHHLGVDAQPAGGVDDDHVVLGRRANSSESRATTTGSPTPFPGSGA